MRRYGYKVVSLIVCSWLLVACGGGGGETTPNSNVPNQSLATKDCALGEINSNGVCRSAANVCNADTEKIWVRGYLDDVYLWYAQIKEVDSKKYSTPKNYFDALLVKEKDRFSYAISKAEADSFFESGLQLSFGVFWAYDQNNYLRVRFVEPNSVAAQAGLVRGDYVISINNQSIDTLTDAQIAELLSTKVSNQITLQLLDVSTTHHKQINLTAQDLVTSAVPYYTVLINATNSQDKVGYLLFNDHIATATADLLQAVDYFKSQNITDLVLDLRFNSGGYAYIANELAAMIGGQKTAGKLFGRYIYNQKYGIEDEYFTQQSYPSGRLLPYLNLSQLFVLTSKQTCSASEAIINSLSPFMRVIRIGEDTCGKPYGMEREYNCDSAYFAISYKTQNAVGQSIPETGYTPTCLAYESLDAALGNPQEGLLANALYYHDTGYCFINSSVQSSKMLNKAYIRPLVKPQWQSNMILRDDK